MASKYILLERKQPADHQYYITQIKFYNPAFNYKNFAGFLTWWVLICNAVTGFKTFSGLRVSLFGVSCRGLFTASALVPAFVWPAASVTRGGFSGPVSLDVLASFTLRACLNFFPDGLAATKSALLVELPALATPVSVALSATGGAWVCGWGQVMSLHSSFTNCRILLKR